MNYTVTPLWNILFKIVYEKTIAIKGSKNSLNNLLGLERYGDHEVKDI